MRVTRMRPTLPGRRGTPIPLRPRACLVCTIGNHGVRKHKGQEAGPSLGCRTSSEDLSTHQRKSPISIPRTLAFSERGSKLEEQGLVSERSKQSRKYTSGRDLVHLPMASGILRGQHSFGGVSGLNNSQMTT